MLKETKLKIKVLYRGSWYYASTIDINKQGKIYVQYCHDYDSGALDQEHVASIIVEEQEGEGE